MATRSLYLYTPLGAHSKHSSSRWRDLLCSPVRCTAILLIVAGSLTSIGFLSLEWPSWGAPVAGAPSVFTPPPIAESELEGIIIPPPHQSEVLEEPVPETEILDGTLYHPFLPPSPSSSLRLASQTVRPIRAHTALSDACADKWVSTGLWTEPCRHSMVQDSRVDMVWVWVNGSDPLHAAARQSLLATTHYKTKEARFREHDELRYSLRAARAATRGWPNATWHVVTADVPAPGVDDGVDTNIANNGSGAADINIASRKSEDSNQRRLGLVPQWLDIECAFYGCPEGNEQAPPIRLQHDAQLFRLTGKPGAALQGEEAEEWLGKILPSFNSHAVESQLPHLDPDAVSDNIVALNDDQFMLLPLPPSAFHTALYGPVFRIDPGLLVGGDSSGSADGGGEWRSLGWSAHLLNGRFGTRKRPYMHHNARALSLPLMHEAALAFGAEFAATPLSQFRGSHTVAGEFEVNTIFLSTHYVIERHREALLWAWVVAKWGDAWGSLDRAAKGAMWRELGGAEENSSFTLGKAERRTENDVEVNILMAGLQPPRAEDKEAQADTTYSWVSMDGYSANFHSLAARIDMRRDCIGEDSEPAWDMFRRLLKDDTACGDNTIAALIHNSRSGLDVFLPPPSAHPAAPSADEPIILPLELPQHAPPLPTNPRAFAVRLLLRYAYVLGDSPTIFMGMKTLAQTERLLKDADSRKDVALLCINDDLGNGSQVKANALLRWWFESRWPEKLPCEV
ncbi:hypothetical protein B0H14DRAFT_2783647 [Mycena olivaceomarginata]|nr:hypothetical protein B0H14DRAFT_2783647 [Mycena olivaceomarginata]